jgi:hypothetical protein
MACAVGLPYSELRRSSRITKSQSREDKRSVHYGSGAGFHKKLLDIAPALVLSGFRASDDRGPRAVEVFGSVLTGGCVAADVPAGDTEPKPNLPAGAKWPGFAVDNPGPWPSAQARDSRSAGASLSRLGHFSGSRAEGVVGRQEPVLTAAVSLHSLYMQGECPLCASHTEKMSQVNGSLSSQCIS